MLAPEREAHAQRAARATLEARAFVALQHLLPQHPLSRLVHRLARSRFPPLSRALISAFMRGFHPDLSDALQPDPKSYPSFNAFFTRALRPGARPVSAEAGAVISPVDGTVSQIGRIQGSQLLQAKGRNYTLEALLGGNRELAARFRDGSFATLYLAPFNYHRIHMPLDGTLVGARFVPGRLFSVNAVTAAAVPELFAINERVICHFVGERGAGAAFDFVLVLVGALFVGSIETVWHGEVTPGGGRRMIDLPLDAARAPLALARGAELGRFNMGSTVILLLPAGLSTWRPELVPGAPVRCGATLAHPGAHSGPPHGAQAGSNAGTA